MKTAGLIGGMSWESTMTYYRVMNETVKDALGGLHSAQLVLYSVDFEEIEALQASGQWDKSAEILGKAATALERAGADFIMICTNTMHKVAPQIAAQVHVPLLHIAEATADALREQGITKTILLGTKYTMTEDFYTQKLVDAGIQAIIPSAGDVEVVNHIIFNELCLGILSEQSKAELLRIIVELAGQGAQAVVLGCTEIGLLVKQEDTPLPVFDTALIHAKKAAMLAIASE